MKILNNLFLLRLAIAVVLIMHGVPSIVTGDVNGFGDVYLREQGFGSSGLPLAWAIKLSHIAGALCLLINRFVKPVAIITILILITGIFMVHLKDGWYVVGGGNNGVEFNFLLIFSLLTLLFPGKQTTA